jgi:hypothetical protein
MRGLIQRRAATIVDHLPDSVTMMRERETRALYEEFQNA